MGPKLRIFKFFSESDHKTFLKLYLMKGIKKWVKVIVLVWKEKVLIMPRIGEMGHFWPKINTSNFSLNLFIRFFWNCRREALKNEKKWLIWTLKEN